MRKTIAVAVVAIACLSGAAHASLVDSPGCTSTLTSTAGSNPNHPTPKPVVGGGTVGVDYSGTKAYAGYDADAVVAWYDCVK